MSLDAYLATRPDRCPAGFAPQQHPDLCTCAQQHDQDEWVTFTNALRYVADDAGTIHQSAMRPLLRGRVAPKHIGALYRRAKADGLIADTGHREPSNDTAGRNTDKLDRVYRLVTADARAAA